MKGEWCYYTNRFSKEQCELIINEVLKLPGQKAALGVNGEGENNDYRKSNIHFIKREHTQFAWLFDEMWKMAIECNHDWFGFHLTKLDFMQLAEYDAAYEGEYKKHHDVFWLNDDPYYHRKLTAVIQLTDPSTYEGGNLVMCPPVSQPDTNEVRTQGTTFFFPSFLEHEATTVTKGTRYSLACWFDGPKWR